MAERDRSNERKSRDGGVSDASEEKKVSSSNKSEVYNAVNEYCTDLVHAWAGGTRISNMCRLY